MKYCTNCGNELANDAKFCVNCGTQLTREESIENQGVTREQNESTTPASSTTNQTNSQNDYLKVAQDLANGYVSYFLLTLKKPSQALGLEPSNYGFIQILVLAFISTLASNGLLSGFLSVVGNTAQSFGQPFGYTPRTPSYEFDFGSFISMFIGFIVIYFVLFFLTYIIMNACSEDLLNMKQTFARYGGFLSLNIVLLALATVLGFLGGGVSLFFAVMLYAFGLGLTSFAFNYSLYKITTKPRINILYVLLIGNLVLAIVIFIVVFFFTLTIVSQFSELMYLF